MNPLLTRRSILLRSAAVLASAPFVATAHALAADPQSRPGIQMFMIAADYRRDPLGTLRQLAAIGYGYVEAFSALLPDMHAFRQMIGDTGLGCPAGHFPFGIIDTEKALDQAAALGVRYAISSILPPTQPKNGNFSGIITAMNTMTADDFRRQAALANRIGESARKRGLQFAYHNHNFEFRQVEGKTTGYEIFLRETDPKLVKLEVDAGWMAAAGADPVAIIRANPDRVRLLHFKDFSTVTPPIQHLGDGSGAHIVNLGTGVVPLKAAYAAARKAGVRYFIVDHDPPFHGQTTMQAAAADYHYVAALMRA